MLFIATCQVVSQVERLYICFLLRNVPEFSCQFSLNCAIKNCVEIASMTRQFSFNDINQATSLLIALSQLLYLLYTAIHTREGLFLFDSRFSKLTLIYNVRTYTHMGSHKLCHMTGSVQSASAQIYLILHFVLFCFMYFMLPVKCVRCLCTIRQLV